MKSLQSAAFLAALLCSLGGIVQVHGAGLADTHPIESVIQMLQGLVAKVKDAGTDESEAYMKFEHWCKTSASTLEKAIQEEKETIDMLQDTIASKTEEKEMLDDQIKKLTAEINGLVSASLAARHERDADKLVYGKTSTDLQNTISAIEQALVLLKTAKTTTGHFLQAQEKVKKALALVEATATPSQRQQLEVFLNLDRHGEGNATRPPFLADGDLGEHVDEYKFKSGGVIELLKKLRLKFQDELQKAVDEETSNMNAYRLGQLARDNAESAADASRTEKDGILSETTNDLNQAKLDLQSEESDLQADTAALEQTQSACSVKKTEWETRSSVREGEIKAMEEAVKILSDVTGVRTEPPENPVPPPSPVFLQKAVALLQLAAGTNAPPGDKTAAKMRAIELLRKEASATHSRALEGLAQEIAARSSGPFDDVVNMVQKMIFRLMDEQKNEDDHKNWCDQELKKSDDMQDNKEARIEDLNTKINAADATVKTLTLDIEAANKLLADIEKYMAEATEIREIGKEENAKSIKDAQDAQTALTHAIAVIEDFYKQSGMIPKEPWEFLQQPVELTGPPSTWSSPYKGVAGPLDQPDGILSVLQTVSSNFATMEADTKAQEEADQKAYDDLLAQNKIEKARRTEEVEQKTQEKQRLVANIASYTGLKKHVTTELDSVKQYLKDLEPACVIGDSTYTDRKAARDQEITALKEVQGILQSAFAPAASFLQVRRQS